MPKIDRHGGVLLWVPMRGGKTRVALEILRLRQPDITKIVAIVFGPKVVIEDVWPDEVNLWAPGLEYVPLVKGPCYARMAQLKARASRGGVIFGINYDVAHRPEVMREIMRHKWTAILLDESHRIKEPGGKQSKALGTLCQKAGFRIGMTGTPISGSKRHMGIWAQYRAIAPDIFHPRYGWFQKFYMEPCRWEHKTVVIVMRYGELSPQKLVNKEEYMRKFMSAAVRVGQGQIKGPPSVSEVVRECDLEPKALKIYRGIEADSFAALANREVVSAANVLVKILRLQQVANGWVTPDLQGFAGVERPVAQRVSTAKEKLLTEVLRDIGEPVVIVSRFVKDLGVAHAVAENLGLEYYEVSGRAREMTAWKADKTSDAVLGVQIQSGKEGVDLSKARLCIWYSVGNNLVDYEQMRERISGPNQERPVTHIFLQTRNTVDVEMLEAMKGKQGAIGMFVRDIARRYGVVVR